MPAGNINTRRQLERIEKEQRGGKKYPLPTKKGPSDTTSAADPAKAAFKARMMEKEKMRRAATSRKHPSGLGVSSSRNRRSSSYGGGYGR